MPKAPAASPPAIATPAMIFEAFISILVLPRIGRQATCRLRYRHRRV
jgi:hypothetical protein